MSDTLERKLRTAEQLARKCDIEAALAVLNEVIAEAPGEMRAWTLRAFVDELAENHSAAREDLTRAIQIEAKEPNLFYTRGRMAYLMADFHAALADFNEGVRLGKLHQNDYYEQELYFWRAATLVAIGDVDRAREDLTHVNDGFCTWTNGLLSKADLLAQCG